jgi:hypothetical protein
MGWRSAFVVVETDDDLERALEVVRAHNAHTGDDAGEELRQLCVVDVPRTKVSRSKRLGSGETVRVLVFGSGGGMWGHDGTWPWFGRAGFKMYGYSDKFKSHSLRDRLAKEMRPIEDPDLELARLLSLKQAQPRAVDAV